MALIGLSIPSSTIHSFLNSVDGLIGLTFKPLAIKDGKPVKLEVNQVIFDPNANSNPVSFNKLAPIGGTVYRETSNGGAPYLLSTESGSGDADDAFQFISDTNNFAFFTRDTMLTLSTISKNLIFSGAAYKLGLMAYANSGIDGDYGSLKVEVDRANMNIVSGSENHKIPAAIIGAPCPPNWDPFN